MIGIIDYGVGNLLSISNIIRKAGGNSFISADADKLSTAEKLILPGVGAFSYGMDQLKRRGLTPFLHDYVKSKSKMILGLCLGAQLMTEFSEEGNVEGLGWVNARTIRFDDSKVPVVPHMNWADVNFSPNVILAGGYHHQPRFYFVHSYHFQFNDASQVAATAFYGYEFACAFQKGNILGVQFHPEKSHRFGIQLFKNYLAA